MALGVPIAYATAGVRRALMVFLATSTPRSSRRTCSKVQQLPLLAVPFFMLAGEIMNVGGLSKRIVRPGAHAGGPHARRPGLRVIVAAIHHGVAVRFGRGRHSATGTSLLLPMMVAAGHDKGRAGG